MKGIIPHDNPIKKYFTLVLFLLIANVSFSQDNKVVLIPRTVYVGDNASLVLPLPAASYDRRDIIISPQPTSNTDIEIHRIALERRISGSRLIVDFAAFVPGIIELPDIEIDGEYFSGITVTVNSILERGVAPELSRPASSLAMPGTAFIIYGAMTIFVVLLLLIILFIVKGRRYLQIFMEKWKLWRLFATIKNVERRLYRLLMRGENKRMILDGLSEEFRDFLSIFTGFNCRAMTAREFVNLPDIDCFFLRDFFHRCDELRFSGVEIKKDEIIRLLDTLRFFIGQIEKLKTKKMKIEKQIYNTEMVA